MTMKTPHIHNFFNEVKNIAEKIDKKDIQKLAESINDVRKKRGRLFFL
jgi:uncharacterized hydantoinase/oxoprolinase family protein